MAFFSFLNKELEFTPKILLIPQVKEVLGDNWNKDSYSYRLIKFIALTQDIDSPFYHLPLVDRITHAETICGFSIEEIQTTSEYLILFNVLTNLIPTPEERAVMSMENKLNDLRLLIDSTSMNNLNDASKMIDVITSLEKLTKLVSQTRERLKNKSGEGTTKGSATLSLLEKEGDI